MAINGAWMVAQGRGNGGRSGAECLEDYQLCEPARNYSFSGLLLSLSVCMAHYGNFRGKMQNFFIVGVMVFFVFIIWWSQHAFISFFVTTFTRYNRV